MRPLLRSPSQYFSAVSWEQAITQASPLMCASCSARTHQSARCQVHVTAKQSDTRRPEALRLSTY